MQRWELRRNNKVLHVFDTSRYTADVAWPTYNEAEAQRQVDMPNAKEATSIRDDARRRR